MKQNKTTIKQRLVRRLDRGFLRITNPLRSVKLGYIESPGQIKMNIDGALDINGFHVDCLGSATAFDFSGETLMIGGHDTGIILPNGKCDGSPEG